jgi:hypothetical protein
MIQTKNEKGISEHLWNPKFKQLFYGYRYLTDYFNHQALENCDQWPTINKYNQLSSFFYSTKYLSSNYKVQFVSQAMSCEEYFFQVTKYRQIPTRINNWHDFFNNISWIAWPKTKWALYQRYWQQSEYDNHSKQRSPEQNFIALFDECGVIVATKDEHISNLVKNFQWKELFIYQRQRFKKAKIFIFGHGMLEKGLKPYIGMTGKALFLKVEKDFFNKPNLEQINVLDSYLSEQLLQLEYQKPNCLQPLPVLGCPNWWPNQENSDFYDNTDYFRIGRKILKKGD